MLLLSRKPQEALVINNRCTIRILGVHKGGRVVLGIEAPPEFVVLREEIQDRIAFAETAVDQGWITKATDLLDRSDNVSHVTLGGRAVQHISIQHS